MGPVSKMRLLTVLLSLFAAILATDSNSDFSSTTTVYIQPIGSPSPIIPLAEIQYHPSVLRAGFASFDAPELSPQVKLVRIGTYDVATRAWKSSTTVTSARSFSRGYAPIIILSLDAQGDVISVTCKSGRIDAGQTRDFGPKVKVVKMTKGKKPELNRPIIVSKEGTVEGELPEKTMFQKYWWVAVGAMVLLLATGGENK